MILVGDDKDGGGGGGGQVHQDLHNLCPEECLAGPRGTLDDGHAVSQGMLYRLKK